ncbi:YicC/YloC family endoribonuclease [uncultured Alistipes sp.]|uniref:YicC/YloC family endoribonuclease n=1 Tax=uncultured Alistipes sp. TaxID=538949 RepID=UPI00261BE187|nr:YicC/YloC family endoribonuclease [uncultured Alistipes sp.]
MTGFGKAEALFGNKKITVEIRSLNSKQLDLNLRLPAAYRQAEYELRNLISRAAVRGKVDAFVSVETQTVETAARIDSAAFAAYVAQLREAAREAGLDTAAPGWDAAALGCVMRLPDVVASDAAAVTDEELAALVGAAREACERLDAFRAQEGATLIADLERRVDLIEEFKEQVVPFEATRTETVRARILDNLSKLHVDVDTNRLEQEMIFYLEKLDITEEKVRLANHCRYFREVAAEEQAAGRKLGFIAQEMGREINTMGSKANHADIQRLVVRMKDELEKIKEQVLNIL